jgi:hypothetical protein
MKRNHTTTGGEGIGKDIRDGIGMLGGFMVIFSY